MFSKGKREASLLVELVKEIPARDSRAEHESGNAEGRKSLRHMCVDADDDAQSIRTITSQDLEWVGKEEDDDDEQIASQGSATSKMRG